MPDDVGELLGPAPGCSGWSPSPRAAGALEAITQFTAAGVLVSVGHSDATADQVARRPSGRPQGHAPVQCPAALLPREPGVVGQALADPG